MNQEDLDDIDEYLTSLSRRFSKLKFKRNPCVSRSTPHFKKVGQQNKSFVDISNFKCYNCGIVVHFSNECRKPKTDKNGHVNESIDYKKKYYDLPRSKEKAFVSEEKDWAAYGEDSDEEKFINLALMANSDEHEASSSNSQVLTTNITELSKDDCKIAIDDMSNELYNLHIFLKSLTK